MNRLITFLCLTFVPFAFGAEMTPAPANAYSTVFACHLNAGKTMDNAWAALEALAKLDVPSQAAPDPGFAVYLWTPFRTASDYDFIFGVNNSTLNAIGQGLTDYYAAPGTPAVEARFAETAHCSSGIVQSKVIQTGAIGNTADRMPDAVVETFACTMKEGAAPDALDKAIAFYKAQTEKIASPALKTYASWLWTPYRGGDGKTDFMWVGAYPDLRTWTQGDTDYYGSAEGQAADARFQSISRCRSSVWAGYWIIAPK